MAYPCRLATAAALALLLTAARAAPFNPNDPPPDGAQEILGKSAAELRARFGAPDRDHPFSARVSEEFAYYYAKHGKTYVGSRADGVMLVVYCTAAAGSVGGVSVDTKLDDLAAKLGEPASDAGPIYIYPAVHWLLEVQGDTLGHNVQMLAVLRRKTPLAYEDGQLSLNEFCPHDGTVFPWRAGDQVPPLAGIRLGDRREAVIARLGKPDSEKIPGGKAEGGLYFLTYVKRGIIIEGEPYDGVSLIAISKPQAGDFAGVKVGMTTAELDKAWGEPLYYADGITGFYTAGVWTAIAELDSKAKCVKHIYVVWNSRRFPELKGSKTTADFALP